MRRKTESEYTPCCALCEQSTKLINGDFVCLRKGVVDGSDHCRKFTLDLLKLEPTNQKEPPRLDPTTVEDL